MKIIIRNEQGIVSCYVQLRDIEYLGERYHSQFFLNYAVREHNKGRKKDDFIKINNRIGKIIEEYPYIVDFTDMSKLDVGSLSRTIILSQSFLPDVKTKADEGHKVEDLVDLISFKRGMLTYPIPVFLDEKQLFYDGEVIFGSTTFPEYYMLRTDNREINLSDYLSSNAQKLFGQIQPDDEMASYEEFKVDNDLLVHFKVKKKLFSKLRKGITK